MRNFDDVTLILDESGSMASICDATINAANGFVIEQRTAQNGAVLSIVTFSSQVKMVTSGVDIDVYDGLTNHDYSPGGLTALYDAIGDAIVTARNRIRNVKGIDRPNNVIFAILTDGGENASTDYTKNDINKLISEMREEFGWTFIFLGANQDSFGVSSDLGISQSLTQNFEATETGVKSAMRAMTMMATTARSG